MKISLDDWREFFKLQKGILILLVFALASSTVYAVYMIQNNNLPSSYLSQYLQSEVAEMTIHRLGLVFLMYFKRCLIVWVMGLFSFMAPFCLGLIFIYIFSYGFSIAWLFINFGIKGIGLGMMSFGIQGVLIVGFLLYLASAIIEKNQIFNEKVQVSYPIYLAAGSIVCLLAAAIECLMIMI